MICTPFTLKSVGRWLWLLFVLTLSWPQAIPGTAAAAPVVTGHSPAAGATAIPADTAISITFSEPMDPATITPGSVTLSRPVRIRTIAAGFNYTVALREDGTVAGWGYNGNGETTVPAGLGIVTAIAAGSNHVLALKNDGTVVAWGANNAGSTTVPPGLAGVTAIAAGGNHSVALKGDGTVTAWGDNSQGQASVPGGLAGVTSVAAGGFHTLAMKSDGTVTAWGNNRFGQTTVPSGLSNVLALAAGTNHSVALKSDGTVVAWGANDKGQSTVPAGLSGVIAIATACDTTLALKNDGTVVAWGDNGSGQTVIPAGLSGITAIAAGYYHGVALKNDGRVISWGDNSASQTTLPAGLTGVTAVAAGNSHTVALKSDGSLFAWGYNDSGQTTIPAGLSGVSAIAAGTAHTLSLDSSGTVTAWGRNDAGQATVPPGLSGVVAIAAGDSHSVALKNDGTVVAWGMNTDGQATVPVGLAGVSAIAAGAAHTLALRQDGSVVAWGSNFYNARTTPVGLDHVVAIAAGGYHSAALKSDGSVVTWGDDLWGMRTVPAGLTGVSAIADGYSHTAALKNDGTVVVWGANDLGQSAVPAGLDNVVAIAAGKSYTIAVKKDGTLVGWGDNKLGQAAAPRDPSVQPIATTVTYSTGSNSATITPEAALPLAAALTTTVTTGVRALDGTHPAADYSWSFTTVDALSPATTPSPAGGTYSSALNVTLTANEPATIYYTTNGSTPTVASAVYSGPIPVSATTTLKFFARDTAGNSEPPRTEIYTISADTTPPVTTPSPAGGTYSSALNVTLTANEPATIYYTTNGSAPTVASPVYGGSIPISATTTLRFFARDAAGNSETLRTAAYTIITDTTPPVTTPSPAGGTYTAALNVILTANEPATIYYTTNGSAPTVASAVYSGPIPIPATTTLKFFARDTSGNSEAVKTAGYTINLDTTPPVTTPSPAGGTYSSALNVTLSANEPATIYYTTNGSAPTISSAVYSGPVPIPATTTLKFFARDTAGNSEAVKTAQYTIKQNQTITFGSLPVKTYGNPGFNPGATASSGLTVSYTSSNPAVAVISGSSVTIVGAGSATITASQGGDAIYNTAPPVARTLTVVKAPITVQGGNATRPYGAANPAFSATYSGFVNGDTQTVLSGSPVVTTAATITSSVGTYPITVTLGTLAAANYNFNFVNGSLSITRAPLTVQAADTTRPYGAANPAFSATYSGFVNGDTPTVLSGAPGLSTTATPTSPVGTYPITAASGTLSADNYSFAFANGILTVTKAEQTITFGPLPVKTYGDPAFAPGATASSGLGITYTSSNPAVVTVSGATLTIVGAGSVVITASQAGDANYNAAAPVTQPLTINKAPATITFGELTFTYDGNPKPVAVTTVPAGLAVVITYNGSTTAPTIVGSYTVVATVNDPNYQGSATATEEIAKRNQTITFDPLPAKTYGDAPFTLGATASSNLAVTYTSSNPAVATVSNKGKTWTVTIVGAGTTIITAYQDGNGNYNNAPPVTQTLTVNKAAATVTLASLGAVYDGTAKTAAATTNPAGLGVIFTYNGSVTPPSTAGSYSVIATIDAPNYQGSTTGTLTIAKANATITLGSLVTNYTGTPRPATATTTPAGLAVTLTYDGSSTAPTAVGSYGVTATVTSQNYQGSATGTLIIAKAAQAIAFPTLPAKTVGTPPFTLTATASSGLGVSYTSSNPAVATINGTVVTIIGAGTTVITASQVGDANYDAAPAISQTLTVNAAPVVGGKTAVTIGSTTSYFDTLTASLAAVPAGSATVIRLQTMTFAEAVNINSSNAIVTMTGGYDSGFTSATGMTTIQGGLTISTGTLIADRLVIM